MTTRLYYQEPYRTSFDARVVTCDVVDGRTLVVLDQTAFYPSSGGQPFDTGVLGGARVLDVIDRDDGEIAHVVVNQLPIGSTVDGRVDWPRRFDHMQQHTGQHVLSAAFDRLFSVRTESFHLGAEASTIDLAREVSPQELVAAEDESNRIVWEDRAVAIRFVTPDEAEALPLRKEPVRAGPLRLIEVEDFDLSACGGTHVARTGAIGVIAITRTEKFRGGSRVEFVCGGRALAQFRTWRDAFAATQKHLSIPPAALACGIERLQNESKGLQRTLRAFQEKLASHEAAALLARGERIGPDLLSSEALEGWDASGLKALAVAATTADPTAAIALFSGSSPTLVVIARGRESQVDASAILKALVTKFGGKGGGKPDLAQGGGLNGSIAAMVETARALLAGTVTR